MVINKRHFNLLLDRLPSSAEAYDYIGFRVVNRANDSYKIGDIVQPSRVWIDGEPTDEYLRGACAVWSKMISYTYDGYEGYVGDTILVLGSNNAEGGNDPGEIVMIEPKVLDIIDAEKLCLE